MGCNIHIKIWIHYFIGDTEGNNKWLGHYGGSNIRTNRPYRDCQCSFREMSMPNPQCVYSTLREMKIASHKLRADNKEGIELFKSISRHTINNALLEPTLPLSDCLHGPFCMFPPGMLHTSDSGLIIYMLESLQIQVGEGMSRNKLDIQHIRMSNAIRRQSERDFPRGTTRSRIIDST
jgi:hypothetical protein